MGGRRRIGAPSVAIGDETATGLWCKNGGLKAGRRRGAVGGGAVGGGDVEGGGWWGGCGGVAVGGGDVEGGGWWGGCGGVAGRGRGVPWRRGGSPLHGGEGTPLCRRRGGSSPL